MTHHSYLRCPLRIYEMLPKHSLFLVLLLLHGIHCFNIYCHVFQFNIEIVPDHRLSKLCELYFSEYKERDDIQDHKEIIEMKYRNVYDKLKNNDSNQEPNIKLFVKDVIKQFNPSCINVLNYKSNKYLVRNEFTKFIEIGKHTNQNWHYYNRKDLTFIVHKITYGVKEWIKKVHFVCNNLELIGFLSLYTKSEN